MFSIGFDLGSSSIKAAIIALPTGKVIASAKYPENEMVISSPHVGWAEQDPNSWWDSLKKVTSLLREEVPDVFDQIESIGIAYQMHGLVLLDKSGSVIRPAIIWCDSRAIEDGELMTSTIGKEAFYRHFLNTPGNFTASKLRWVKEHEINNYNRVDKFMLPGDYLAFRMSGSKNTTISGLSEGIFWNFTRNEVSDLYFDSIGFERNHLPKIVPNIGLQGVLLEEVAKELQLKPGIPIGYRAGDQPNNALSLGVMEPGDVAGTAGTSGVIYVVTDQLVGDSLGRVNSFAHLNHSAENPRIGVLLCINGTGIQYNWIRKMIAEELTYDMLEAMAQTVEIGSEGCLIYPFGNGAERIFQNAVPNASIQDIDFNRHGKAHLVRAALEGIANSFIYGMEAMMEMGITLKTLRVGNDNLFQSRIFARQIANVLDIEIEIQEANGAQGAAKASAVGANLVESLDKFTVNNVIDVIKPGVSAEIYKKHYIHWKNKLEQEIL